MLHQVPIDKYSYLLDLAVTSESSNETYVNYYCAACNGDANSLVRRELMLNCTPVRPRIPNSIHLG